MRNTKVSIFLGFCLIASVARGGDAVSSFAKNSLAVDLEKYPLGMQLNGHFQPPKVVSSEPFGTGFYMVPPVAGDDSLAWYQNEDSSAYKKQFPHRDLIFGFKDGRLVAVRVSLNSLGEGNGPARVDLDRIYAELAKAKMGNKADFDQSRFHIQSQALCSTAPGDTFVATLQFTPKK